MNKLFVLLTATAILIVAGSVAFLEAPLAAPPESEVLAPPTLSPAVTTPDVPTFIAFTTLIANPDTKSFKLQFFDPTKNKWKTLGKLRDDGLSGDGAPKDGTLGIRLQVVETGGTTELAVVKRQGLKIKGQVTAPAQVRLVARQKGVVGRLVSPAIAIQSTPPSPVAFGGSAGPTSSVDVPATFTLIDASDPAHVKLEKEGADGYVIEITVGSNTAGLALEQWIFLHAFGFTEPGDVASFQDYPSAIVAPLQIAGLNGLEVQRESESGSSYDIFLEDPGDQQIIWFAILPTGARQETNFLNNLPEALSVVQSLQQ